MSQTITRLLSEQQRHIGGLFILFMLKQIINGEKPTMSLYQ
uniref:Uncharacterized protein n=1 Tax=Anguilla anguilla TaxID=7936 RepID=A0A0E9PIY7_ANGAN